MEFQVQVIERKPEAWICNLAAEFWGKSFVGVQNLEKQYNDSKICDVTSKQKCKCRQNNFLMEKLVYDPLFSTNRLSETQKMDIKEF